MDEHEQLIAIAEAYGWTGCYEAHGKVFGTTPDKKNRFTLPDYLHDLNAMHEAEKIAVMKYPGFFTAYVNWLVKITGRLNGGVDATAAQRAEALLHAIGKWKE